jgi:hypothetical protein
MSTSAAGEGAVDGAIVGREVRTTASPTVFTQGNAHAEIKTALEKKSKQKLLRRRSASSRKRRVKHKGCRK